MSAQADWLQDKPPAREPVAPVLAEVLRKRTVLDAIEYAQECAALENKQVYSALGWSAEVWSRIFNPDAKNPVFFDVRRLKPFMDLTNDAPPRSARRFASTPASAIPARSSVASTYQFSLPVPWSMCRGGCHFQRESVMQEMQRPDGSALNELFTGEQVANGAAERRRKLLEAFGYEFVDLKPVSENKYSPHQGSKEIARRVKQLLKAAQKPTESA